MRHLETGWLDLLILLNLFSRGFTVRRVSVPEEHLLYLPCDTDANNPNMEWRNRAGQIIASKSGAAVSYLDQNKYDILDRYLIIKELEQLDAGEYYCNAHLEAEVEVLTGREFSVAEGRTLLIPCESDRKQVWSFRKEKTSRRVIIFTVFKNGTIIRERDDPQRRFVPSTKALEIDPLELEDSGKYMCNGKMVAKLTVTKAQQDPLYQTTTAIMNIIITDSPLIHETGSILKKVAVIAVVALCVLVLSAFLVTIMLSQRKRTKKRKKKKNGRIKGTKYHHEETELQPQIQSNRDSAQIHNQVGQSVSAEKGCELHYASLGRKKLAGQRANAG